MSHPLGVPLHAEHRRGVVEFDRFDVAVVVVGDRPNSWPEAFDHLMVHRVDPDRVGAEDGRQARPRDDVDAVHVLVVQVGAHVLVDVLDQGAAHCHVEHLDTAACRERGHVGEHRGPGDGQVRRVALRIRAAQQGIRQLPVLGRVDIATTGDPKLDVFTYDVGAEVRSNRWNSDQTVTLRPFAGIGAGARSYNYRSLDVDATHNVAAYASMGGDVGYRRVRVRIEARDYVTGYKPLVGTGAADTRNDVVVMAGFRLATR